MIRERIENLVDREKRALYLDIIEEFRDEVLRRLEEEQLDPKVRRYEEEFEYEYNSDDWVTEDTEDMINEIKNKSKRKYYLKEYYEICKDVEAEECYLDKED